MSARRKISVRKIIQTLVTLIVVAGCTIAMLSADYQHRRRTVRDVQLKIQSPCGVQFLTEAMVYNTLFTIRHINPGKQAVDKVDERAMEAILQSNPWVKEAQVYTDAARVLHIGVTQRVPVVRLFEQDGNSYYLDAALQTMPLSGQYTHYTPVVTGVPPLPDDSSGNSVKGAIVGLVGYIARHPFWRAQISQIVMRADGGFELIPVLGRQRIIIGDTGRIGEKLANLFAFYRQIQNRIGWDTYTSIDLRYSGQVVASPALRWKVPVDRALSNMNWLKAIMESAPAGQAEPGGDASAFSDSSSMPAVPVLQTTGAAVAPAHAVQKILIPPARAAIVPKSPHLIKHGLPPDAAAKGPGEQSKKNTTSNKKNTKPHAATNR